MIKAFDNSNLSIGLILIAFLEIKYFFQSIVDFWHYLQEFQFLAWQFLGFYYLIKVITVWKAQVKLLFLA